MPRVTLNTHNGTQPVLTSPEWIEEEIFLNEIFRLKDTNKFFIYHKVDNVLRIDPIGMSLDSMGIYSAISNNPPPNGMGVHIWDSTIEFSNVYASGGNTDSALKMIIMDSTKLYSITLGQLMDKIPHAYKMDGDTVINNPY